MRLMTVDENISKAAEDLKKRLTEQMARQLFETANGLMSEHVRCPNLYEVQVPTDTNGGVVKSHRAKHLLEKLALAMAEQCVAAAVDRMHKSMATALESHLALGKEEA